MPLWTQHMKTTDEKKMGKRDMKMVSLKASERLAKEEVVKGKSDKEISKLCIAFRMEVERNVKNMGYDVRWLNFSCNAWNMRYFQY